MIDGAVKVDDTNFLDELFRAQSPSEDSFLTSPAYFLHTGRRGLWLLGNDARYILYCHHPNQLGSVLIFPQPGKLDVELWDHGACALANGHASVALARIPSRYREEMRFSRFERHEEEVLDWRYPCTVLNNRELVEKDGSGLKRYRQKLHRFAGAEIVRTQVTMEADARFGHETRALIDTWATSVAKQRRFPVDQLRAPNISAYERAISEDNPRFNAIILLVNGRVVAFFTTEQPLVGATVNGITMCIDRTFSGSAELAHYEMAALHLSQGFSFTNINGAETESLDRFRKKLMPELRYEIDSYHRLATQ